MENQAQTRFSDRVADYLKYRPGYADDAISWLIGEAGLSEDSLVADIGSGTGIFTACLLNKVKTVFAVEPNGPMREAAESLYSRHKGFISVIGSSEQTGLQAASVDLITAAQAFHWFKLPETLVEFKRVLRPGGPVALIWNERQNDSPFLQKYEQAMIKWAQDYVEVNHSNITQKDIESFFPGGVKTKKFDYVQIFDCDALIGRMLSSSYCPNRLHPNFPFLQKEIYAAFDEYQQNGKIPFIYKTVVYVGRF